MQMHRDTPMVDGKPVFIVVFTLKSDDCVGGNVLFSKRNDGKVTYSRDCDEYVTENNSAYPLYGSHVTKFLS